MRKPNPSLELGTEGEKRARALLEHALAATGSHFSGAFDLGVDLHIQFPLPATGQPYHLGAQVKTGNSFVKPKKKHWVVQNVKKADLESWRSSQFPVIFVWVRPGPPTQCFWRLVKRRTQVSPLRISKQALVSPVMRFDLPLYLSPSVDAPEVSQVKLLRAPLGSGIRPYAKDFYRHELMTDEACHPVLGPIRFSWRGWKHLTSRRRSVSRIAESLSLLRAVPLAIRYPKRFVAIRRVGSTTRGDTTTESRLLVFDSHEVPVEFRGEVGLRYIIRESVTYPKHWEESLLTGGAIKRTLAFESVYQK